jgi:hypothetical protein
MLDKAGVGIGGGAVRGMILRGLLTSFDRSVAHDWLHRRENSQLQEFIFVGEWSSVSSHQK